MRCKLDIDEDRYVDGVASFQMDNEFEETKGTPTVTNAQHTAVAYILAAGTREDIQHMQHILKTSDKFGNYPQFVMVGDDEVPLDTWLKTAAVEKKDLPKGFTPYQWPAPTTWVYTEPHERNELVIVANFTSGLDPHARNVADTDMNKRTQADQLNMTEHTREFLDETEQDAGLIASLVVSLYNRCRHTYTKNAKGVEIREDEEGYPVEPERRGQFNDGRSIGPKATPGWFRAFEEQIRRANNAYLDAIKLRDDLYAVALENATSTDKALAKEAAATQLAIVQNRHEPKKDAKSTIVTGYGFNTVDMMLILALASDAEYDDEGLLTLALDLLAGIDRQGKPTGHYATARKKLHSWKENGVRGTRDVIINDIVKEAVERDFKDYESELWTWDKEGNEVKKRPERFPIGIDYYGWDESHVRKAKGLSAEKSNRGRKAGSKNVTE